MKALSVCQPWAHAILALGKNVENRSWPTSYRGPLLIHASKTKAFYDREDADDWREGLGMELPAWANGPLVAATEVVEPPLVLPDDQEREQLAGRVDDEPHKFEHGSPVDERHQLFQNLPHLKAAGGAGPGLA